MADLSFRNIIISFIFFSLVITGVIYAIYGVATEYPTLVNQTGNFSAVNYVNDLSSLNTFSAFNSTIVSINDRISNIGNSSSWLVTTFGFLILPAEVLGSIFSILFIHVPITINNFISQMGLILGIPYWFVAAIKVIIIISIIFLVLQIILKIQNI